MIALEKILRRSAAALLLASLGAGVPERALAAPIVVQGLVSAGVAGSYTSADLGAFGASVTATIGADVYSGVSLWRLLAGAAGNGILTSGGGNNAILRNFVVVTDRTGAKELVSVGEIHPNFGGQVAPFLVAYELNGVPLATPMLIDVEDPTRTRNVANVASFAVVASPRPPIGPGGPSAQLKLGGVAARATYDLAGLQALPPETRVGVQFLSGSTLNGPNDFTGVDLWDLLQSAGIDPADLARSYLLATGSDGYEVLFTLAELNPAWGGVDALVAYGVNGGTLGGAGFARLVIPGDLRGGRYVSNLTALDVRLVPEPASLPLLAGGLGAWCITRRRRSGKGAMGGKDLP